MTTGCSGLYPWSTHLSPWRNDRLWDFSADHFEGKRPAMAELPPELVFVADQPAPMDDPAAVENLSRLLGIVTKKRVGKKRMREILRLVESRRIKAGLPSLNLPTRRTHRPRN